MPSRPIRVLVVDDSAVMRRTLGDCLGAVDGIEVVGTASDGRKALAAAERLCPDVVTLDIHMPVLDGLATLDAMLALRPIPVIVVSALTQVGADITLDALDRGAVDYIPKPEGGSAAVALLGEELVRKVRTVAGTDVNRILQIRGDRKRRLQKRPSITASKEVSDECPSEIADACIVVGVSTGGPPALSLLFEGLAPPLPPVVVVQHMPPNFTRPLAWRLDSISSLSIQEAAHGEVLRPNHVLIAPGGRHLELRRTGPVAKAVIGDGPSVSSHKPSVDVLMQSAAAAFGPRCLGVIMTGMGRDGVAGCRAIREAGGFVLGQDADSSDVYGMNKVAFDQGGVDRQFGLDEAAAVITRQVRRLRAHAPA